MQTPQSSSSPRELRSYPTARPIRDAERESGSQSLVRLGSNEAPLPPSPRVVEALHRAIGEIHRYPDPSCCALRSALAARLGVSPWSLIFGSGTIEILDFVSKSFIEPEDEVIFPWPSFAMYPILTAGRCGRAVPVPLDGEHRVRIDALHRAITPRTRALILANPNNPTGRALSAADLDRLIRGLPARVLLVCDEAYGDFARARDLPDGLALVRARPNTLVLRTFSKAYGLAGLRVGYGVGAPELIEVLEQRRQPFNVNALAQVAAEAALQDEDHHQAILAMVRQGIEQLEEGVAALGLHAVPTDANFLLIDVGQDAAALELRLTRRGVLARALGAYGLDQHLRVTAGLPSENARFLDALAAELGR